MTKNKIYVVRKGHRTGIFDLDPWDKVKTYVEGYPNAEYKSFSNLSEAKQYYMMGRTKSEMQMDELLQKESNLNPTKKGVWVEKLFDYSGLVVFTDGSNMADASKYSFGMVALLDGVIVHTDARAYADEFCPQRNVAGELKGAIAAMTYAKEKGHKKVKICYDYRGIEDWATGVWRAKKDLSIKYVRTVNHFRKFMEIEFVKVPAHSNVKYNDMADELAKGALDLL